MEEFWENNHKNKDVWWISSTYNGNDILNLHKISIDINNLSILDIGIGAGNLIKHLHNNNNNVYACDISKAALENVATISKTYLTNNLKDIPPVDIAISNLMFQHCDDNECERIINDVNLKNTGYFTFQFAYLRDNEEPTEFVKDNIKKKTHYFRSKEYMINVINRSNKKILKIHDDIHHYGIENFSWSIIVVCNK